MTPLTQTPVTRWLRAVGVAVGVAGLAYFLLVYSCRVDTTEGSDFMVSAAPRRALPLGIAAFLLSFDAVRRWTISRRVGIGLLTAAIVWATTWQLLVHRARYPERVIRSMRGEATQPNPAWLYSRLNSL
jgi:hypothetical protein